MARGGVEGLQFTENTPASYAYRLAHDASEWLRWADHGGGSIAASFTRGDARDYCVISPKTPRAVSSDGPRISPSSAANVSSSQSLRLANFQKRFVLRLSWG